VLLRLLVLLPVLRVLHSGFATAVKSVPEQSAASNPALKDELLERGAPESVAAADVDGTGSAVDLCAGAGAARDDADAVKSASFLERLRTAISSFCDDAAAHKRCIERTVR
jgi:hypothetical protein